VRKEIADFLISFIEFCLNDHRLTIAEVNAVREIRELAGLKDDEVVLWERARICKCLQTQIDWTQQDFDFDYDDELLLVELQCTFGLSYDQLLELAQPHVAQILDGLVLQLSVAERKEIRHQIDRLKRAFFMQRYEPPLTSTSSTVDELADRHIPQSVKDAVWRRDGGRCVKCDSNQNLEFDHIIPFSLGGANTYRNVQLLCESCNRAKSVRLH
jgi:hypothetical protein